MDTYYVDKLDKLRVVKVIDGDTFDVSPEWSWASKKGQRVRVADVHAPEIQEPGGRKAKHLLQNILEGKRVRLFPETVDAVGRNDCLVARYRLTA